MEYRPITQEEAPELMELQARSFFFTYDRKKYAEELKRNDEWRNGRAGFDASGRLMAGLTLIPYDVWFDGTVTGMGGIGGVASSPEGRHSGLVRGLMGAVLSEMYDKGDTFSYLFPFAWSYYRKFGYEAGMRLIRIKAPLEACRQLRQPGRAERFIPGESGTDPSPVIEIYNDFASKYNMSIDRQGWSWRDWLEHDPVLSRRHTYIWYAEDSRPGAYIVFKSEPEHNPDEMRVMDAAWRDRDSLLGLLGFLGSFSSNLRQVVWDMPPDMSAELIWPEFREIKTEISYCGMNRVVNAQQALRLMRKPEGSGSVRVRITDDFLPQNAGVYKVDWEKGKGSVRRVKTTAADLECSIHALAQLVTGYLPLPSLALRGDIEIHSKAAELESLFPAKNIYMADRF